MKERRKIRAYSSKNALSEINWDSFGKQKSPLLPKKMTVKKK